MVVKALMSPTVTNKKLDALYMAITTQTAKLESMVNAQNIKIAEMAANLSDETDRFNLIGKLTQILN